MRRPTFIILACLGFMIGILLGNLFVFIISKFWYAFLFFAVLSCFVISKNLRIIPIFLALLIFGICIVTTKTNDISRNGLSEILNRNISVEGRVIGDPYWDQKRNYVFVVGDLKINGVSKSESIKIKTFSSAAREGNRVRAEGKIFSTISKPGYSMSYAKVSIIDSSQPVLVTLKNKLYRGSEAAIGGEPANFIKGILVGARSSLSQDMQDTLNSTGLSHVVAVSGYNLTILVVVLQRLLRKKWAWGSLVLSLFVVWAFVALTGGSSSIMRAAIMASVFLIASYYGRQLSIFACISLTAVATLLINPFSLTDDIGWQLSFLSLSGIVILAPIIQKLLPIKPQILNEIFAITLAAQIATAPYVISLFGKYSAISLVANSILMPLVPIIMLLGFTVSLLGIIMPSSSFIIGSYLNAMIMQIFDFLKYLQLQKNLVIDVAPSYLLIFIWYFLIILVAIVSYNKRIEFTFQKS